MLFHEAALELVSRNIDLVRRELAAQEPTNLSSSDYPKCLVMSSATSIFNLVLLLSMINLKQRHRALVANRLWAHVRRFNRMIKGRQLTSSSMTQKSLSPFLRRIDPNWSA